MCHYGISKTMSSLPGIESAEICPINPVRDDHHGLIQLPFSSPLSYVFQRLCECCLDSNAMLRAEVKRLGPAALRRTCPLGTDMQGNQYWMLEVCGGCVHAKG